MILSQRIGKSWYLVRPAPLRAVANFDGPHSIPPIMNSFWTGSRWTFISENGKAFGSQKEAGTYLALERDDMERVCEPR
jgi:hypothetical protein